MEGKVTRMKGIRACDSVLKQKHGQNAAGTATIISPTKPHINPRVGALHYRPRRLKGQRGNTGCRNGRVIKTPSTERAETLRGRVEVRKRGNTVHSGNHVNCVKHVNSSPKQPCTQFLPVSKENKLKQ